MNKILISLICIIFTSCCSDRKVGIDAITPTINVPFGCTSKAVVKIVNLGNNYYDQNMTKENFKIEIQSLNDNKMDRVIVMYPIVADKIKTDYVIGSVYEVDCYETIKTNFVPRGWDSSEAKQFNYMIERFLVIKKSAQQGDAPEPATNADPASPSSQSPAR